MKPEELTTFKGLVENNLMDSFENASNYQNTASNALNGLHDDGKIGGTGDSWKRYAKSGDIVLDLAGGLGGGVGVSKVVGKVSASINKVKQIDKWSRTPRSIQDRLTLETAKKGKGVPLKDIMLKDPRYKGMEKWEYKVKSKDGKDSVVHYIKDPKTGKLMDFKFKKHSS